MGATLEKFEIILNNSDKTFSPGDTVTGRVIIGASKKKIIKGLEIICSGKAKAKWKNVEFGFMTRTTTYFTNVEDYFELEYHLLGGPHGESFEIDSGCHVLPFTFVLPQRIPSSYKRRSLFLGELAEVRYTIEAKVQCACWKSDVRRSVSLTVRAPYDLALNPLAKIPIQDEADEVLGCFPYKAGLLNIKIFTPTCGFATGESIEARIGINNYSACTVKKIQLRLIQEIRLHGPAAPVSREDTLQKAEKLGPFGDGEPIVIYMQVPEVPSSGMPFCNVMTIRYFLEVEFVMSGWLATLKQFLQRGATLSDIDWIKTGPDVHRNLNRKHIDDVIFRHIIEYESPITFVQ